MKSAAEWLDAKVNTPSSIASSNSKPPPAVVLPRTIFTPTELFK
jgi:hypothetical protein